ncbi:hypothetical protein [Stenotrophomonas sp. MMGLT7]|uniref:hypothetical protein n=1 Tax=Stenotrophomonas sp. MMGLT7 TaxID=2901227 RepID=UPI001E4DCE5E|nr:hypothetical protein [Stenotrophomonas sp. MMGLT7]MCD7097176.1 hypothetical protein [Stenotrophomonas sp. MMGLT7]
MIDLLLRTGSFQTDTARAEKSMRSMKLTAQDVGKAVGNALAIVGSAAAAGGAAVAAMTAEVMRSTQELDRLAQLANTSFTAFQGWAAGAQSVGVAHDKLADVLKDVQDKVGDFLQTGGGPLKDFFDNIAPRVGLTADQLKRMSGADALGAYFNALEKANLSQSEMVFYMEAIASDSSRLIPLLKNGSAGFREWADEAQRMGAIIDDDTATAIRSLQRDTTKLDLLFDGLKVQIAKGVVPALDELTSLLKDDQNLKALQDTADGIAAIARAALEATSAIAQLTGKYTGWLRSKGFVPVDQDDSIADLTARRDALQQMADRWTGVLGGEETRQKVLDEVDKINGWLKAAPFRTSVKVNLIENGEALPDSVLAPRAYEAAAKATKPSKAPREKEVDLERLRDQILATDDLDRAMIAADATALQWGDRIDDMVAQMSGPAAVALLDYTRGVQEANAALRTGVISQEDHNRYVAAMSEQYAKASEAAEKAGGAMSTYADQAARNMQDSFADFLFRPFDEGLSGLIKNFAETLEKMAAQAASAKVFQMIGSWASSYTGAGSGWINAIGSLIGGKRAAGGPVWGGGMFEVGEGGRPELLKDASGKTYLIPGNNGRVSPVTSGVSAGDIAGNASIGGDTFQLQFNVNGSMTDRERAMMEQATKRAIVQAKREIATELATGRGNVSKGLSAGWTTKRQVA